MKIVTEKMFGRCLTFAAVHIYVHLCFPVGQNIYELSEIFSKCAMPPIYDIRCGLMKDIKSFNRL